VILPTLGRHLGWGMVASDSFAEFLREHLAPLGHVTVRRMFGKTGVFCDGLMLGCQGQYALLPRPMTTTASPSRKPSRFRPSTTRRKAGTIDLAFWRAPERLFDEPDEFVAWARAGVGGSRTVAAKRTPAAATAKIKTSEVSGAPRPMKMGNIASPRRYDVGPDQALQ